MCAACAPVLIWNNYNSDSFHPSPPREGFEPLPEGQKSLIRDPLWQDYSIQRFPSCRGRPSKSLEGEASLVLMRLSIELLYNDFLFSQPFLQWLDNRSIVTFYSADGGVRAKQRNVEITQKGDSFLGSKPGPFFNFSTLFSSRLIFLLLSSARVGATLSPRWSVVVTDHSSNPLGTNWSEFECRLLG